MDELSEEDKLTVAPRPQDPALPRRSRSTSPKSSPASPASSSQIEDTVKSFKAVVDGEYDHLPESAFYMVGGIDEAIAKAKKLAAGRVTT